MATSVNNDKPTTLISEKYISASRVVLVVRKRPHLINGGGFVVTDCSQKVVFRVDGCGIMGKKAELILRNGDGDPLLLVHRKALSIHKKWRGYTADHEGPVFIIKQPSSCFLGNSSVKNLVHSKQCSNAPNFEIKGHFPNRDCSIVDSKGNVIAQVGVRKDVEELMTSKDIYHVVVKPGIDQALVFGVIAALDHIYG